MYQKETSFNNANATKSIPLRFILFFFPSMHPFERFWKGLQYIRGRWELCNIKVKGCCGDYGGNDNNLESPSIFLLPAVRKQNHQNLGKYIMCDDMWILSIGRLSSWNISVVIFLLFSQHVCSLICFIFLLFWCLSLFHMVDNDCHGFFYLVHIYRQIPIKFFFFP